MRTLKRAGRLLLGGIRRFSHFLILCYVSRQGLKSSILSDPTKLLNATNIIGTSLQAAEELFINIGLKDILPSELSITLLVSMLVCSSFAPLAIIMPKLNLLVMGVLFLLNWQVMLGWQGMFGLGGESQPAAALVMIILVWEYFRRKRDAEPRILVGVSPMHVFDKRALAQFADQLRNRF